MTKQEFDEMVYSIVENGISVTMQMHEGKLIYDLNTDMKSHLYLHYDNEKNVCTCYGRYGLEDTISDYRALLWAVKGCLHGRDFGNEAWLDLLSKERVLEIIETTTRTFK